MAMKPRFPRALVRPFCRTACVAAALATAAAVADTGSSTRDLAEARAWVERARARDALWTTAVQHLRAAEAASAAGREQEAATLALEASELARLGLEQRAREEARTSP